MYKRAKLRFYDTNQRKKGLVKELLTLLTKPMYAIMAFFSVKIVLFFFQPIHLTDANKLYKRHQENVVEGHVIHFIA